MITEESGIAKGIRRIVAVTGHEAHDVTRLAQSLGEKLDILEVSTGKTKDSGLKAFSVVRPIHSPSARTITYTSPQELGQADISVLKKAQLKDRLAAVRKAHDKQIKDREAQANKNVRCVLWH